MEPQYIYLIQEREFIKTKENIYKIGKTKQSNNKRFKQYPNGSVLICQFHCEDCTCYEKKIIIFFKKIFKQRNDIGTEYFQGNLKSMIHLIYNIIFYNIEIFEDVSQNNINNEEKKEDLIINEEKKEVEKLITEKGKKLKNRKKKKSVVKEELIIEKEELIIEKEELIIEKEDLNIEKEEMNVVKDNKEQEIIEKNNKEKEIIEKDNKKEDKSNIIKKSKPIIKIKICRKENKNNCKNIIETNSNKEFLIQKEEIIVKEEKVPNEKKIVIEKEIPFKTENRNGY